MKKLIKFVTFLTILLIIGSNIFNILWATPNAIKESYKEPKNSIDVAYFGASNALAHFNTVLAFNKYGYTTAMMSVSSEPFTSVKFLIEEIRKKQNPKVYVIDISSSYYLDLEEGPIRRVIDAMPNSINRYNTVKYLLKDSKIEKKDYINYFFSFFHYHSYYKELTNQNIKDSTLFKGYLFYNHMIAKVSQKKSMWNTEKIKIEKTINTGFDDLIKYIKDNNINVLFVLSPRYYDNEMIGKLNTIIEKIESNDLKVLNFNVIKDLQINFEEDLFNAEHLNVWGAAKFTEYFGNYLKEKYNLPDHRNDKKYNSWEKEYERFKQSYNELTKLNFDDYYDSIDRM